MPLSNHQLEPSGVAGPRGPFRMTFDAATQLVACLLGVFGGTYNAGIFLATPPHVTIKYLKLLARRMRKPCLVLAEKPWAPSLAAFQSMVQLLDGSPLTVRFLDHYLSRGVILNWQFFEQPLEFYLGGPITAVKGHLFESMGAVSPAMSVGVLRDLCVHLITVVSRLFPGDRLKISRVWAARHDGWPSPSTDSYVRLLGSIDTLRHRVSVNLAAAKDYPIADKVLVLQGPGARLCLDLTAETADLISRDGNQRRLYPHPRRPVNTERPYLNIFRRLLAGDKSLGLDVHEAEKVLVVLDEAEKLMPPLHRYEKGAYPLDTTE
jgi:hypothetical protein